ncbi:M6 family metalloprotease domain-containing protein [Streptomyces sp. M10(2022)]
MQQLRHRIRKHSRPVALIGATALVIATMASASSTLPSPAAPPRDRWPPPGNRPRAVPDRRHHGVQMSEGMPTPAGYTRSTGEVRALNLMIDFPDAHGTEPATDRLAEFFPQTADWFRTSSYGRLTYTPEAPVTDWLRMPLPFSEYGIERGSPYEPGYRKLVKDLVATADPKVDFSAYDLVNVLVTPNAGPSALDTVLSVTFSGNDDAPFADGVPLANASFVYSRQDDGSGSYAETGYRVLPHENGHVFGLPDLYTMEGGALSGTGTSCPRTGGQQRLPRLAQVEARLARQRPDQLLLQARHQRAHPRPLATKGGTKLAFAPLSDRSGYAVEVRTPEGNDEAVCRPGVLIYKVSSDVDTGQGPVSVVDSTEDSGGCTRRPNVHAELSDATFEPGETFTDRANGIRISVLEKDADGNYRVRITRP